MEVRKTTERDDLNAIGDIYAQSWKNAYKGIVPQQYLDELSGNNWSSILTLRQNTVYLLIKRGKYIGVASAGASRDEKCSGWGEIYSIYLLPEHFGTGSGKILLDYMLKALAENGYKDIFLWTLADNMRARHFYEKCGFTFNGDTEEITIGGAELMMVKYIWSAE